MNTSIVHRLLWGAFIVVIGVVFLLNQVGLISMDIGDLFRTYWPVFMIVFGLQGMLLQRVWWNLLTVIIGCYFLGRNLGMLEWSFGDFARILGPVAVILFGLSLIFRGNRPSHQHRHRHRHSHQKHEGWNPVHPGSPHEPPIPPVPPGPPPAPPELEEFERRSSINLGKEPKAEERPHDYGFSRRGPATPPPPNPEPYWKDGSGPKDGWWGDSKDWKDSCKNSHSRFIGDVHFGNDYWELRPMNISHFIGDTTLDLTKAQIPVGETRVYVSSFIGDVKVFVPNDLGVGIQVVSSSLIGDVKVLGQKRGGLFNQMSVETPFFPDSDKRVVLIVSSFIGDVRVTKVG